MKTHTRGDVKMKIKFQKCGEHWDVWEGNDCIGFIEVQPSLNFEWIFVAYQRRAYSQDYLKQIFEKLKKLNSKNVRS